MSYQVLARKWRPRRFAELVGQEHVVRALTNALDTGRIHHAYLFTGTRGVGKTTIARIFAKSLNCERGRSKVYLIDEVHMLGWETVTFQPSLWHQRLNCLSSV